MAVELENSQEIREDSLSQEEEQQVLPVDVAYVRDLERRLRETEAELGRMRAAARVSGLTAEAVMSGKAAYDWKKDSLELKLVIGGVSRRYGLLEDLATLRVDETSDVVPVIVTIRPLVEQQRMTELFDVSHDEPLTEESFKEAVAKAFGEEEPQATASAGDTPAKVDAGEDAKAPEAPIEDASPATEQAPASGISESPTDVLGDGAPSSEGNNTHDTQTPPPRTTMRVPEAFPDDPADHTLEPPPFTLVVDDYANTGLPLYILEANFEKSQLAEAAYQAGLPECVIELVRTVRRGQETIEQRVIYHYRGPGGEPVIERITSARHASWLRELQARRGA